MIEIKTSYPVEIGETALTELEKFVGKLKPSTVFILTDENVNKFCIPILVEQSKKLSSAIVIEIPSGEEEKNITTAIKIMSFLLSNNADRKSLLINVGGGVVCDIGGLTASLFKRGIRFINVPTTLLSMVDASVGGKNGVNFLGSKNIIGTFNNPEGVFIYPEFTKSLSQRERRSGYAEIIKHVLLADPEKWKELQDNNSEALETANLAELITHSVKFKAEVTTEDFREEGRRNILNFGHTIGHALESFTLTGSEPLRHGEAVAAGMIAELFLSNKLSKFPEDEMNKAINYIRNVFSDVNLNCAPEDLIPFLYSDKKNAHDMIAFSLLKSPGIPAGIVYPDLENIVESLIFMNEIFSRTVVE
jgi:3-dehydroquinate synthase